MDERAPPSLDTSKPAKTNEPVEEIDTHYKLLEAFDWHERARTMVRERLGWQLLREVP